MATCSAKRIGWCHVMMFAAWPRRMRCVLAAIAISLKSGFGLNSAPSGLEVVLRLEPVVEAEPVGEDALPHLVHDDALVRGVDVGERAVVHDHAVRRADGRQIRGTVVKDANLDHLSSSSCSE